jgi:hypothetical protein
VRKLADGEEKGAVAGWTENGREGDSGDAERWQRESSSTSY